MSPRGSNADIHAKQILTNLTSYVDASNLQEPFNTTRVTLVDGTAGSDVDGQPGRPDLPFATIQRAVNCSSSGDIILVGGGLYAENVVIPSSLTSLTIAGVGMYSTVIQPLVGIAVAYTATSTGSVMTRLILKDLSLRGTTLDVFVNSTLQPTAFQNGVILDHVCVGTGAGTFTRFTVVNDVQMYSCTASAGDAVDFIAVSTARVVDCIFGGALRFTYTFAYAVKPSLGRGIKTISNTTFTNLATDPANIDDVRVDSGCTSTGAVAFFANDSALGNGYLEFHGNCVGNMTLTHTLLANRTAFVCDRCKLVAGLFVASAADPGSLFIATASFRESVLYTAGAGTISTGNESALDLIGAQFNHTLGVLATAGATVPGVANRSVHRQGVNILGGGTQPVPFAVDFMDANYQVGFEMAAAGVDPFVTNKLAAGFDLTSVGADALASLVVVHD